MDKQQIIISRLQNQQISAAHFKKPEEIVSWLGGLQAQDYNGAKWTIGLRLEKCTDSDVEQAIVDKKIVRTWPMRGTLHFVAAADIRWLLQITAPRNISGSLGRRQNLELTDTVLAKSRQVLENTLGGHNIVTREEALLALEQAGIRTTGQRGYHILWSAALHGLICFGPAIGKQQTFVLLEEWIPKVKSMSNEEAFGRLAQKYFFSHGPVTVKDFIGWSGLTARDAKIGLEIAKPDLVSIVYENQEYWFYRNMKQPAVTLQAFALPGFDEYVIGYKDRNIFLDPAYATQICPGNNGMFMPTIVSNGEIKGIWKKTIKKNGLQIVPTFFTKVTPDEEKQFQLHLKKYAAFFQTKLL